MRYPSLNHVFRLVWSTVTNAWVAVAETTRGRGKSSRARTVRRALLASLLAAGGAHAQTQLIDGGGGSGCMIGVSACSLQTSDAVYTNFFTQGGAGSGGGAGLGGVFFVDSGATLQLNNVSFMHNVVKGGEGGSSPDVNVGSLDVTLLDKTADVSAVSAMQVAPTLAVDGGGNITVSGAVLTTANSLIKSGAVVTVAGTTGSTTITNIADNTITFDTPLAVDSSAIKDLGGVQLTAGTSTITAANFGALAASDIAAGMSVVGTGIPAGTTILEVTRDGTNAVTGIKLSNDISSSGAGVTLKLVDVTSFKASQFQVSGGGTEITLPATGLGLAVGMTLSGSGIPAGTTITAINGNQVTLSQAIAPTTVEFTGSLPATVVGQNTIRLTAVDSRLKVGSAISGSGIPAGTTITAIDTSTGVITLSNNLTGAPTQFSSKSITAQSGAQLTLLSTSGLEVGMQVEGEGIPAGTTISAINGNVVTLSSAPTGTVNGFVASSPYRVGGSLNNIAITGVTGANGGNGVNASSAIVYITDGEGRDGTNGGDGKNGSGSVGGSGGNGGSGSNGIPFNFELTKETLEKTADAVSATAEAAAALATFPPNGALSAAHIAEAAVAYGQLAIAIANLTQWGIDLSNGTAGRGGAGGNGGDGGDGSTFYGGGAGGAGGDGGSGALSHTDGGDGGEGGEGGAGGFGAGGGSGGAGGAGGGTGNASDGEAGAGGQAGFGGGVGSNGDGLYGGGGSGYGGAIFVRNGGTLTLSGNVLFRENTVLAGSSNNGGESGQAAGSDIFMMKGSNVLLAPGNGKTIRIEGQIADDSSASIAGGSYAPGAGADLRIGGGGLVQLAGTNTYSGKTILEGATLETTLGQGIHPTSSVVFNGQGSLGGLNTGNAGVLLLSENVTQRAGSVVPGQFIWNGAGGFAAGTADGITVNFGKTTNGPGQVLSWGSSYLANSSTLVFGSEYSQGSVELQNDINLNGNTGKVAVYGNLAATATPAQTAYLSGKLTNGSLEVGSAGYAGTLFLTGQNELSAFVLNTGVVSTLGAAGANGRLLRTSGGSVTINGGALVLAGEETMTSVAVAAGGQLVAAAGLTAGNVVNDGVMTYLGDTSLTNLTNNTGATFTTAGGLTVAGSATNHAGGTVYQLGDATANGGVVNDGFWAVDGARVLTTPSLTGAGTFHLDTAADTLALDLAGNTTFDGNFSGAGGLFKAGAGTLMLTGASSHQGGTTVLAGAIDTSGGGTLADNGALAIAAGAAFVAGTADTVGAVSNSGTYIVTADQHVASLTNAGTTHLVADLAGTGTVTNDGVLNVWADRQVTTAGLSGGPAGTVNLAQATDVLTLNQTQNTTYGGHIVGAGSLVKTGAGTLTLNGTAGSVDIGGLLVVDQGTVALNGGYILAQSMGVLVNSATVGGQQIVGTLQLVSGDQSIYSLGGAGRIDLGATNRLTVQNGGSFTGTVVGSGVLDIRGGSFQIDNDITSTDPTSVFNLGGDNSPQASTTIGADATLTFPAVELQQNSTLVVDAGGSVVSNNVGVGANALLEIAAGGTVQSTTVQVSGTAKLDVQGTLTATNVVVSSNATSPDAAPVLHLGNPTDPTVRGSVVATLTEISGGVLSGNGALSGQVVMGANSWLNPGNSPGSLQFADLTLGNLSTTTLEVGGTAGSRVAGVDYDSVQVSGSLRIDDGASLVIERFGAGDDLARGETVKLFDFRDGQVSGKFASVQKTYGDEALFNVSTGSVIGLGSGGYGAFYGQVARGRNDGAMLNALQVEDAGGVRQFYGGKLLERLATAYANGTETASIFAKASPEAYTSLIEQGRQALFFTPDDGIASDIGGARGATASLYTRSRSASNSGYADYDLDADGVQIGYSAGQDLVWKASLGIERGKNRGDTLSGHSDGLIGTVAAAKSLPGVQGLFVSGRVSYAAYDTDASRQTSAGVAKADGIKSSAWLAGLGLVHLADFDRLRLKTTVEAAGYGVEVDGFTEANTVSATDALSVRKLKQDGSALLAGVELSGNLSDNFLLRAGANVVHDLQGDDHEVAASVNGETAAFSVRNPGLGRTQFSVRGGMEYRMGEAGNIGLTVHTFGDKGSQASVSYSKRF